MTSVTRLLCFYQLIVENDKGVRCMALVINGSNSLGLTAYEKHLLEKNVWLCKHSETSPNLSLRPRSNHLHH